MTDQPLDTSARPPASDTAGAADGEFTPVELLSRRQPGDPHPYMLERNPPNLWILAFMTIGALAGAVIVLVLTVLL